MMYIPFIDSEWIVRPHWHAKVTPSAGGSLKYQDILYVVLNWFLLHHVACFLVYCAFTSNYNTTLISVV